MKRIPQLDGWRGIAILLVLADHLQVQWGDRSPWICTGTHGVTLFFVLSGFLITSNLLKSSDLKTFYVRRFFRLMPVAWTYLLFLSALGVLFPMQAMSRLDLISCLLFFRNYVTEHTLLTPNHFWSLSIEEQFYLVWPAVLILIGKRRAVWFVAISAAVCAAYRLHFWGQYEALWQCFRTEVRFDALCVGCLLALLLDRSGFREKAKAMADYLHIPALAVFIFCISRFHSLPPLFECVAVAVMIAGPVLNPERIYSKLVSFRPLAFIGIISYSMYVWQHVLTIGFTPAIQIVLDLLIPLVALASYNLIEKPFIALGRTLTSRPRAELLVLERQDVS
jgi:peptidoglycan/LPS O-acetylase OafA/YrhL